jgi:acetylornithine deacetylase
VTALSDRDLLARLVAFPSVSGLPNLDMVEWIARYADAPGVRIWRDPSEDGTRCNLVLSKGPAPATEGDGLTLAAHMDVVPAVEDGWFSPPFELTETGLGLSGRGASDMKGFLALALNVFVEMDAGAMRAPLALVLTYDEEVGTVGARELFERGGPPGGLPVRTIIGEPTCMEPVRAHKGHIKYRLRVHGRSAHSAYRQQGHSAIVPAAAAVLALEAVAREMEAESLPAGADFPDSPYQSLNVGVISGGSAVNVVPEECVVDLGVRAPPGADAARVTERVRSAVAGALQGEDYEFQERGESPPLVTPAASEWLALQVRLLGREVAPGVSYATDGGWLARLGLECVVCGPGDIGRAHRPNEYITPAELAAGRDWLERLARQTVGGA